MSDKETFYEKEERNNSLHWYNNKGFYLVIDKIMLFIAGSSLDNDYTSWIRGVDRLASFTRNFWKSKEDYEAYEQIFESALRQQSHNTRSFSTSIKNKLCIKTEKLIRKAEALVFKNISYMMIRVDIDSDEDLDWLKGDEEDD